MKKAPVSALILTLILFSPQILLARGEKNVIVNRGSDSMAIAVLAWAEGYQTSKRNRGQWRRQWHRHSRPDKRCGKHR